MPSPSLEQLSDLFLSLFREDEFHSFIASLTDGKHALREASVSHSFTDTVNNVTIALSRRGAVNHQLFESLEKVRPGRVREIRKIESELQKEHNLATHSEKPKYDFYMSYASPDKAIARELYNLLVPDASVFLDAQSLSVGDEWDSEIFRAVESALITLILVSSNTAKSANQRREIEFAIGRTMANRSQHRVVPVFLDSALRDSSEVPYELRSFQGIAIDSYSILKPAAKQLLEILRYFKQESLST